MGAVCCKRGTAAEEVLTPDHLAVKLVKEHQAKFNDSYEVMEVIGEGSISRISKIRRKQGDETSAVSPIDESSGKPSSPHGHYYALKEVNMSIVSPSVLAAMNNEIDVLKRLDHPNILKIHETFKWKGTIAIVMDLCTGGDLYEKHPYSERQASFMMQQILSALVYLHDRNIVHRDLKYENIMFANNNPDDYTVVVIDFGLAKKFLHTWDPLTERVGTIYTMAPEVTRADYSGATADMWSLGVIAHMILVEEKPFWAKNPKDIIRRIRAVDVNYELENWNHVSANAKHFVSRLLKLEPSERMTATAALQHPFIKQTHLLSVLNPDKDLTSAVTRNLAQYAESTDFKKIALFVIAKKMSADEIVDLRKVFVEFDTENDGTISYQELRKVLSKSGYTESEIKCIFRGLDVNHTGTILYTEFLAAALEAKGKIDQRAIADAFHELDEDMSGYISRKNLRAILPHDITDEQIDRMIADVDKNRDGHVSFEEFQQAFVKGTTKTKLSKLYD